MSDVERNEIDPRSPDLVRVFKAVDTSGSGRIKRKYEAPSIGERFGMLTVTGYIIGPKGGIKRVVVQCDCGRPEHGVHISNLRGGRSVRCNTCAKEHATNSRQKAYLHYAGACPHIEHRRRLLNRISAIQSRCYNPNNKQWMAYGGRGITCWWFDTYGDERIGRASRTGRFQTLRWKFDMLGYLVTLNGWDNPDLELDRIDNNKGYEPGNLRFVSRRVNMDNRRTVDELSQRIKELEERLRLAECRPA